MALMDSKSIGCRSMRRSLPTDGNKTMKDFVLQIHDPRFSEPTSKLEFMILLSLSDSKEYLL